MPVQLPLVPSVFNYRVGTTIDGIQYLLDVRWNGRDESWYVDILDDEGTLIRAGMKAVLGSVLGARDASGNMPDGQIMMSDLSGAGIEATFDDIGSRVALYFFGDDE